MVAFTTSAFCFWKTFIYMVMYIRPPAGFALAWKKPLRLYWVDPKSFETFYMNFGHENLFSKNDSYRDNFMQGIDYAHSISVKTLPWFSEGVCSLKRNCLIFENSNFCRKIGYGFFDAGNRLRAFSRHEKISLTLI